MRADPDQARFWRWFEQNGDRLRTAVFGPQKAARDSALAELGEAVQEVTPGLILEFDGPAEARPRRLIVSADGKPEHVEAVKDLVTSAPALSGWQVVAFRPRMVIDTMAIELPGERVDPADVWFRVSEEEGLAVTLFVRGLTRANQQMRGLGASLIAQHAVGER